MESNDKIKKKQKIHQKNAKSFQRLPTAISKTLTILAGRTCDEIIYREKSDVRINEHRKGISSMPFRKLSSTKRNFFENVVAHTICKRAYNLCE